MLKIILQWGDTMNKNEQLIELAGAIFELVRDRIPQGDTFEVKLVYGEGGLIEKHLTQCFSYEIDLDDDD